MGQSFPGQELISLLLSHQCFRFAHEIGLHLLQILQIRTEGIGEAEKDDRLHLAPVFPFCHIIDDLLRAQAMSLQDDLLVSEMQSIRDPPIDIYHAFFEYLCRSAGFLIDFQPIRSTVVHRQHGYTHRFDAPCYLPDELVVVEIVRGPVDIDDDSILLRRFQQYAIEFYLIWRSDVDDRDMHEYGWQDKWLFHEFRPISRLSACSVRLLDIDMEVQCVIVLRPDDDVLEKHRSVASHMHLDDISVLEP